MEIIKQLAPRPCKVNAEWPEPETLTALEVHTLSRKSALTVGEAVSIGLYVARIEGVQAAMPAFETTARVLLNFVLREKIEMFDDLTPADVRRFILKETGGLAFSTTEEKHLRRNLLMLIHLACNAYCINVSRHAATMIDLQARAGGPRRAMMDDEITLARLAAQYVPIQESTGMSSGRSTHVLRSAMWGIVESGAGSGELAQLTARSITGEETATHVDLIGTRDAAARTVELTSWAQEQCSTLISQLNPDPVRVPGLFYNGQAHPGSAAAQSSMSGVMGEIFVIAGLKQIKLKSLQAPMWRARSVFDATQKLADASGVLGCTPLKAITVLGIDSDNLGGMRVSV